MATFEQRFREKVSVYNASNTISSSIEPDSFTLRNVASVLNPASNYTKFWFDSGTNDMKYTTSGGITKTILSTAGLNLSELGDVSLASLAQNDSFYYDFANSLWKNKQAGLYSLENTTSNFIARATRPVNLNLTTALYNIIIGDGGTALTTGDYNIFMGSGSGINITTGSNSICMGFETLNNSGVAVSSNIAIGNGALKGLSNAVGSTNVAIGDNAGYNCQHANASDMTLVGTSAGQYSRSSTAYFGCSAGQFSQGERCVAIGYGSLMGTIGTTTPDDCIAIGYNALNANLSGINNVVVGNYAGDAITTGQGHTLIGKSAGSAVIIGNYGVCVGLEAGLVHTGDYCTFIGTSAGKAQTTSTLCTACGCEAMGTGTGDTGSAFGHQALNKSPANGCAFGYRSQYVTTGISNCTFGNGVMLANITGTLNAFFGTSANEVGASGNNNCGFGVYALNNNTANNNSAFGYECLKALTSGTATAFGYLAGTKLTTSTNNTIIGNLAMSNTGTTGVNNNVAIGSNTLKDVTSTNNCCVGYNSAVKIQAGASNCYFGSNTGILNESGNYNILIGHNTGDAIASAHNNVLIGHNAGLVNIASSNTCVGFETLKANTTGTLIDAFGYMCLTAGTLAGLSNITAIGNSIAIGTHTSNSLILGNTTQLSYIDNATEADGTTGALVCLGGGSFTKKLYCSAVIPTNAVAVANGGTGQTSYTNGQLLIGNTTGNTLTKATLTAGSGIGITNSTGSITIAQIATNNLIKAEISVLYTYRAGYDYIRFIATLNPLSDWLNGPYAFYPSRAGYYRITATGRYSLDENTGMSITIECQGQGRVFQSKYYNPCGIGVVYNFEITDIIYFPATSYYTYIMETPDTGTARMTLAYSNLNIEYLGV